MYLNTTEKEMIKEDIISSLKTNKEVKKIIVFGSFFKTENPGDIDVALFEDSDDDYLTLALKYRKQLRKISKILPIDIIPLKAGKESSFLDEINHGTVIYER
ncbi:MAG: nucleotidyltransferase domain-containing protein [Spirochaetae bacterium HGW-Spirochaetae-1]|jgi:predicted nucleotidyltransferase|nr:MAG: nucleotidyltransferase domain-containing protein [Spirochaetae bacterium HGW-Spirochaetae-1]